MNDLLKLKQNFVSLIAKLQNKMCCWLHSFTLFTGAAVQRTTLWHALLFGIYGNIGTCHTNHVGNLVWHLYAGTCCE